MIDQPLKKYMCALCGLVYDEAEGWPDDGIEPGTRWADVPESWMCPECSATKDEFEMIEL
jgi:rubredoxin